MNRKNFIVQFFNQMTDQIEQISTPYFNDFFKQTITVIGVTVFFSIFFYVISFCWIKFMIFIYSLGV
jgi:preprotein translocase SecE subunit